MGGIDQNDQMMTSCQAERKRVKKWYKKYFMHLVNVPVFNDHIIANKVGNGITAPKFREKVIRKLFSRYSTAIQQD